MSRELKARLYDAESFDVTFLLDPPNLLYSLQDHLLNEYMFHKSEYRIYLDAEEISDNAERFEECVNNGTVTIVVQCNDDVITLRVPGYTTIKEIHDIILDHIIIDESDMLFPNGYYTDLDCTQSVFDYGMGTIDLPDEDYDFEPKMYPCRYSFPCAETYDHLSLISTQHSLHLYQPVQLPNDYLTGEAVEFKEIPIESNWKDHVIMMPTPGLFGYQKKVRKSLTKEPSHSSFLASSSLFSSSYYEKDHNPIEDDIEDSERETTKPKTSSIIRHSIKPLSVLHPVTASDIIYSSLPSTIAMTSGREQFLERGIQDLSRALSYRQGTLLQMNDGNLDVSPVTENTELSTSQAKHHYYHITTSKRGSVRRLKTSGHSRNESIKQDIYSMMVLLKNRKDLEEVPKAYFALVKDYHNIAYEQLSQSSFIQLLITVAFEYVNDDLFDVLLPVALDYLQAMDEDKKASQLIIHTITMDMILNILKTMNGTQVDRRILFLQFLAELVKDPIVTETFYNCRGIDVLIQINETTGSINIRNYSLGILRQLIDASDPRIVYSAYHAVFQIFQKEANVIVTYVKLLNERLKFYDDYEHAIVVKNDVINIRVLYPSNSIIQTNCNLYLSHYNNACSCIVLYFVSYKHVISQ